jgi:hypothetical protein
LLAYLIVIAATCKIEKNIFQTFNLPLTFEIKWNLLGMNLTMKTNSIDKFKNKIKYVDVHNTNIKVGEKNIICKKHSYTFKYLKSTF